MILASVHWQTTLRIQSPKLSYPEGLRVSNLSCETPPPPPPPPPSPDPGKCHGLARKSRKFPHLEEEDLVASTMEKYKSLRLLEEVA